MALPGICFSFSSASIGVSFSTYIPLMRLVQTVHHTKRRGRSILREGWLLHHTNTDLLVGHNPLISFIFLNFVFFCALWQLLL